MAEEYNLPLGLDISKVLNDARTVKSVLNELNTEAENVGKKSAKAFEQASSASVNMGKRVVEQAASFGTTTRAIENMEDALSDLKKRAFDEKDTRKVQLYRDEIKRLEAQIDKLNNAGKRGFDEFGNKVKAATKETNNFHAVLQRVAVTVLAAFGVRTLINFGREVLSVVKKVEGVETAFKRLNAPGLLEDLRKATRGTVSDLELMQRAVLANQFNIPIRNLASFYEFASKRARELGVDTEKFVSDVITGTARGSIKILDNLGLSAADVRAEVKKTGDYAQAVFNIIERDAAKNKRELNTTADTLAGISATYTNIQANIGKSSTGIIATIAGVIKKELDLFNDFLIGLDGKLEALGTKLGQQNSGKFVETFTKDDPAERAKAIKGYEGLIERQAKEVANYDSKIQKTSEDLSILQRIGRSAFTDLNKTMEADRDQAVVILAQYKAELALLKGVEDREAQDRKRIQDQLDANAEKRVQAEEKRQQRIRDVNAERIRIQNEYYSSQIEAIEDSETRAVATETVGSQNRVRELENRKKLFPELVKEINRLIEEEQRQSNARVLLIIKHSEEEQLKAKRASQKEIARVLKEDTDVQIDAINDRFDIIVENAKKTNTLTTEVEVALAIQRQKEITDVTLKAQDERLKKQEELALSGIYIRQKRESQTQKAFERENQIDILEIQIEFSEKRLALIATDPAKIKEANDLRKAIQDARNELNKMNGQKNIDLLDLLGIDQDKLRTVSDGISTAGAIASDFFAGLDDQAQLRVEAIQTQIDAIDDLISKQEEAVDREKELMDKGFANNFANAQRTLLAQKVQRDALLKQEEEARKKQQELQRAQIVADSIAQASNLITASTDIFKVFAKIPIIGVPLAIAAIATMFGGFAIAKVNAFNATKLAEGGTIGGKSHSEGGNKYVSIDGNGGVDMIEHERGEEVTKKASAEKHRKLLKAINADDFTSLSINDASIQALLEGTGVLLNQEKLRESGRSTYVINQTIVQAPDHTMKEMAADIKMLVKLLKKRSVIMDMGDYVLEIKDNIITKHKKKNENV